jgi:hypothetical protein
MPQGLQKIFGEHLQEIKFYALVDLADANARCFSQASTFDNS